MKEILEREQEDVDSYLDAAKFICGAEDVFASTEEEPEEEAFEEQLIDSESDVYASVSIDECSKLYEKPKYVNTSPHGRHLPLPSTISMPKSNLQFSSKVLITTLACTS